MRIISIISLLLISLTFNIHSQTIEEFELGKTDWGTRVLKKSGFPKRIYIWDFKVNYQLLINWLEVKKGGRQFGGGVKGDATAQLMLGIKSIEDKHLTDLTDSLYLLFKETLKKNGYLLATKEEISNSEILKKYKLKQGGYLEKTKSPGQVIVSPSNEEFYERIPRKFFDAFARTRAYNHPHELSEEFNIAFVSVNLNVSVFEDAESGFSKAIGKISGEAKLNAATRLKLNELSKIEFAFPKSNFNYKPNNGIRILDVIPEKEFESRQSAEYDNLGTDYGSLRIFSAENRTFKNLQVIECNPLLYQNGVIKASNEFIKRTIEDMNQNY
jgi:hypothetical protein